VLATNAPPSKEIVRARTPIPRLVLDTFSAPHQVHPDVTEFAGLLQLFLQASTLRGRFDHYFLLMRWMGQSDGNIPLPSDDSAASTVVQDPRWRRSHVLRAVIIQSAELRTLFAATLGAMVAETSCVSFFAEAGLPNARGFLGEAVARSLGYCIPAPRNDADLEQQLRRLYRSTEKARRFTEIPAEMFHEIVEAFSLPDHREIWKPGAVALREAFLLLADRAQSLGLSHEMRVRGSFRHVTDSPFFKLSRLADAWLEALESGRDSAEMERAYGECAKGCRNEVREITRKLNETGVSISIVFSMEVIEKCLHRMESIADVLRLPDGPKRSSAMQHLISLCILATFEDTSLTRLVASNLQMLSKKIVECTGEIGGHYIARNLREYWYMWAAAAGGGLLTVATATFKMKILSAHLPPLMEGLAGAVNYSISFILLLILGLALATKQPAMTGAALAGILRERGSTDRLGRIVDTFVLIFRTQLAAALGNILMVTAGSLVLGSIWLSFFGAPILNAHEAEHVFETLDPFAGGTIFFATMTGVILWFSSLAGGWIGNWSVYNRLPQGIADHALGERLGVDRMRRIACYWERNVSAWGGSIVLGFLLAMTPVIGTFAGLPLDVRHVTLSTGTLALSISSLGYEAVPQGWLLLSAIGIAIIFVLNLSVSFLLAFATAVRAYELSSREIILLAGLTLRRALRRPWEFVLPIGWPAQAATDKHA
jgi:site-specific recombinase